MNKKSLFHITKRDALPWNQAFAIRGAAILLALIVCVASTLFFAQVAALFANKAQPKTLNRITGAILVILGAAILAVNEFG